MLREKQRNVRMRNAVDAAESLIRRDGSTDFTMKELADLAGLSPATPFNLFGSKSGLLYALLNRCMDQLYDISASAAEVEDPFDSALQVINSVAQHFASDPQFYRPLLRHLVGVADAEHRPAYLNRGIAVWHISLQALDEAGKFKGVIDKEHLSRVMVSHFLGVLDLWVQGELSDTEFPAQSVYGLAILLISVANTKERKTLLDRIEDVKSALPENFSG